MDIQGNAEAEELSEPDYRCVHGTFIGNPYGGDYICGYCEDGVTREEYLEILTERQVRRHREIVKEAWFADAFHAMRTFYPVWAGNVDRHPFHAVLDEALAAISEATPAELNAYVSLIHPTR